MMGSVHILRYFVISRFDSLLKDCDDASMSAIKGYFNFIKQNSNTMKPSEIKNAIKQFYSLLFNKLNEKRISYKHTSLFLSTQDLFKLNKKLFNLCSQALFNQKTIQTYFPLQEHPYKILTSSISKLYFSEKTWTYLLNNAENIPNNEKENTDKLIDEILIFMIHTENVIYDENEREKILVCIHDAIFTIESPEKRLNAMKKIAHFFKFFRLHGLKSEFTESMINEIIALEDNVLEKDHSEKTLINAYEKNKPSSLLNKIIFVNQVEQYFKAELKKKTNKALPRQLPYLNISEKTDEINHTLYLLLKMMDNSNKDTHHAFMQSLKNLPERGIRHPNILKALLNVIILSIPTLLLISLALIPGINTIVGLCALTVLIAYSSYLLICSSLGISIPGKLADNLSKKILSFFSEKLTNDPKTLLRKNSNFVNSMEAIGKKYQTTIKAFSKQAGFFSPNKDKENTAPPVHTTPASAAL